MKLCALLLRLSDCNTILHTFSEIGAVSIQLFVYSNFVLCQLYMTVLQKLKHQDYVCGGVLNCVSRLKLW